jgi:hypothetical protein
MERAQQVIAVLLVIAIVFSVASVVLNMSLLNAKMPNLSAPKVFVKYFGSGAERNEGGQVQLVVEKSAQ